MKPSGGVSPARANARICEREGPLLVWGVGQLREVDWFEMNDDCRVGDQ